MSSRKGTLVVVPGSASLNKEFLYLLCVIISGMFLGFVTKLWNNSPIVGEFGAYFGIWVFAAAIVAFFSNHPFSAVINVPFFFLAVLTARWLYEWIALGYFPRQNWKLWVLTAVVAAVFGFLVWIAKGNGGYLRSLCASLPVAVLIAEGFRFSLWNFPELLNLVYATALVWIMNPNGDQRSRTAGWAAILTLLILQFQLFRFFTL